MASPPAPAAVIAVLADSATIKIKKTSNNNSITELFSEGSVFVLETLTLKGMISILLWTNIFHNCITKYFHIK